MQEMSFSPAAALVVVAIVVWAVLAIKRIVKKGLCDCKHKCSGCTGCLRSRECSSCAQAGKLTSTKRRADVAKEVSHDTIA